MSWHDIMSWHELHRLRIFSEFQLFLKCHFYWTSSKGHSLKDNYEIHLKYVCITHCGASGPTKWPQSTLRQGLNHVTQYAFIAYRSLWNHRKKYTTLWKHTPKSYFLGPEDLPRETLGPVWAQRCPRLSPEQLFDGSELRFGDFGSRGTPLGRPRAIHWTPGNSKGRPNKTKSEAKGMPRAISGTP